MWVLGPMRRKRITVNEHESGGVGQNERHNQDAEKSWFLSMPQGMGKGPDIREWLGSPWSEAAEHSWGNSIKTHSPEGILGWRRTQWVVSRPQRTWGQQKRGTIRAWQRPLWSCVRAPLPLTLHLLTTLPPVISHILGPLPETLGLMENREHFITYINMLEILGNIEGK